jgi:hypothetical protein
MLVATQSSLMPVSSSAYEYPGDPIARGVGSPVSHTLPA